MGLYTEVSLCCVRHPVSAIAVDETFFSDGERTSLTAKALGSSLDSKCS